MTRQLGLAVNTGQTSRERFFVEFPLPGVTACQAPLTAARADKKGCPLMSQKRRMRKLKRKARIQAHGGRPAASAKQVAAPVPCTQADIMSWVDSDGTHMLLPTDLFEGPETLDQMTEEFQRNIRQSPLWDQMVERFGREKAEQLLSQCRAELH